MEFFPSTFLSKLKLSKQSTNIRKYFQTCKNAYKVMCLIVNYPKKLQLEFIFSSQGIKYLAQALSNYPFTVDRATFKEGQTHLVNNRSIFHDL